MEFLSSDAIGLGGGAGIEQADQEQADREEDGLIRDLAELRQHLQYLRAGHELAAASIDVRSGTVTQEVVEVLDALSLAGFEQISFGGSYED